LPRLASTTFQSSLTPARQTARSGAYLRPRDQGRELKLLLLIPATPPKPLIRLLAVRSNHIGAYHQEAPSRATRFGPGSWPDPRCNHDFDGYVDQKIRSRLQTRLPLWHYVIAILDLMSGAAAQARETELSHPAWPGLQSQSDFEISSLVGDKSMLRRSPDAIELWGPDARVRDVAGRRGISVTLMGVMPLSGAARFSMTSRIWGIGQGRAKQPGHRSPQIDTSQLVAGLHAMTCSIGAP